jgi:hypothetical protein
MDDTGLQFLSFGSREEARAWIRRLESRTSYLEQNETGPATYTITEVGSPAFRDAYKHTRDGPIWSLPVA